MSSPIRPPSVALNGITSSTSTQNPTQTQTTNELEPSLDTDPDVDMAAQDEGLGFVADTTQENDPIGSSSTIGLGPGDAGGGGQEVRQEALDLNLEESRMPLRKDVSLREFLGRMDEYAPVIPDAVTFHALTLAGLKPPPLSSLQPPTDSNPANPTQQAASQNPPLSNPGAAAPHLNGTSLPAVDSGETDHVPLRLARLMALATQKFISDIATDAYQYSRMRTGVLTSNTLSTMANPGAAAGAAAGTAGGGTGGGPPGAGGAAGTAAGAAAAAAKGGVGAHVLGMQRAGFGGGGQGGGQNRTVLTMEDLGMAVGEYGVNVRRGEFYR